MPGLAQALATVVADLCSRLLIWGERHPRIALRQSELHYGTCCRRQALLQAAPQRGDPEPLTCTQVTPPRDVTVIGSGGGGRQGRRESVLPLCVAGRVSG